MVKSCIPSRINRPTLKSACISIAIYSMVSEDCCVKSMSKSNWRAVSISRISFLGRSVIQSICFLSGSVKTTTSFSSCSIFLIICWILSLGYNTTTLRTLSHCGMIIVLAGCLFNIQANIFSRNLSIILNSKFLILNSKFLILNS